MACLNHLVPEHQTGAFEANGGTNGGHSMWYPAREASTESLIIGALEAAFWEMDQQIGDDKKRYKMLGKNFLTQFDKTYVENLPNFVGGKKKMCSFKRNCILMIHIRCGRVVKDFEREAKTRFNF